MSHACRMSACIWLRIAIVFSIHFTFTASGAALAINPGHGARKCVVELSFDAHLCGSDLSC